MASIFISYRRDHAKVHARAIFERLRREFGANEVFIDLDGIEYGLDFVDVLDGQLEGCGVMLALIDPQWASATDSEGGRRIDRETDFVRIEVTTALERGIRTIPVLIDGASIPDPKTLPSNLRPLVRRQALDLDFARFDAEMGRLVHVIRKVLEEVQGKQPSTGPTDQTATDLGLIRTRMIAARSTEELQGLKYEVEAFLRDEPASIEGRKLVDQLQKAILSANPQQTEPQNARQSSEAGRWWFSSSPALLTATLALMTVSVSYMWFATGRQASVPPPSTNPASEQVTPVASPSSATPSVSGRTFRDCDICPQMKKIPASRFTMGSPANEAGHSEAEGPARTVSVGAFALGVTQVTRGEYAAFVAATGHTSRGCYSWKATQYELDANADWRTPGFAQDDTHPVVCVNWDDAKAYVAWLSKTTGQKYRLPTEAEWEYAARAGTTTARYWGEDPDQACGYANVADQTMRAQVPGAKDWTIHNCTDGFAYTAPASFGKANGFGLHGMLGNAWQWTEDCWHETYTGAPVRAEQPWGAESGGECNRRVVRGGSWVSGPGLVRAAARIRLGTSNRSSGVGFRVARTLP